MKMRIQGNAIRFRLNRREVDEFARAGYVQAAIGFPGGRSLTYALERAGEGEVNAQFSGDAIRILVPETTIRDWAGSDQVTIHARLTDLEVILEKDFQCLHKGEAGKDPDAYPNPMA
jgi:hypothetical protein